MIRAMRWRRKKPDAAPAAAGPDEAHLVSEVLGYPVAAGSTETEMSAALASDALFRLESLREDGLWTDELERRWQAVEEAARSGGDVQALTEAVEALLDEASRVRNEQLPDG
jgi:hypothetical protein